MKVENLKVYDLDESIKASGYPMRTELDTNEVETKDLKRCFNVNSLMTENE